MHFTPLTLTFAILGISLLVVVHEAGHYLAARAFGMKVLRFSIGLGPPLWKYQPKDSPTVFQVCAIPLLAYVQIAGMNPTEEIDKDDPTLYPNKGVFARIVTIFAGPAANYIAASVMLFVIAQVGGLPDEIVTNRVAATGGKGTPAQLAKLATGDTVVEVNGHAVTDGEELIEANRDRARQATTYVILRDGERFEITLTPELRKTGTGQVRALIGVVLEGERVYQTHPIGEAARYAVLGPYNLTLLNLQGIARLVRRPDPNQIQSVVGMTKVLSTSFQEAPQQYVWILIQISIALGLFNLLPFPALDGGRLTFLGYELITRRRANERVEAAIHTVGLLFLLGVLALVMVRDVINLT
ncbi:MAG: RIP metalloprotease [Sandaracinaceae bacterium]